MLYRLYTAIAIFPGDLAYRVGKISLFKDFHRRALHKNWKPYTSCYPFNEFMRLLFIKAKMNNFIDPKKYHFNIDWVYQRHDRWVARNLKKAKKNGVSGVYAFEDGALESFEKSKELGLQCIYDLTNGYWKSAKSLLKNEFVKNPEWAATLLIFKDSPKKLARKDRELELADLILVASNFTKKTLEKYVGNLTEIHVVPYGFPKVSRPKKYIPLTNRKLKVLFVGGLSQRKGISYMFKALEGMEESISLTLIGKKVTGSCEALNEALKKHHWIPSMPHSEILEQMRSHDVLLFPSLFEGFGLVITEAMSQGTPVITTSRTAGPDLISHGKNGWLVETASSSAIRKVFSNLLENPSMLKTVGQAARERAKKSPWSCYQEGITKSIKNL